MLKLLFRINTTINYLRSYSPINNLKLTFYKTYIRRKPRLSYIKYINILVFIIIRRFIIS